MDNIQKIKLLNELMSKATPQNVDFTPHNGNYCDTAGYATHSHLGMAKT